jgi:hypothetical protein
MRRLPVLVAMLLSASPALAQDTVIVRHVGPPQDTAVVVRHIAPPPGLIYRIPPPGSNAPPPAFGPRPLAFRLPPKDPGLGTMLSVVFPGGGQFYAGEQGEGAALMVLGIGAPVLGILASQPNAWNNGPSYSGANCNSTPFGFRSGGTCRGYNETPAVIGIGVGAAAWLFGVATASTDVERWNQAHGVQFVSAPGHGGVAVPFP